MYELTGRIKDLSFNLTGKPKLTIELDEKQTAIAMFDELKDCEKLSFKVGKFRNKRSNEANAYMWVLCGKLAEKLCDTTKIKHTKEDIYRNAVRELGICRQVEIDEKAADTLIHSWSLHGLGWFSEQLDYGKNDGFVLIDLYYGSSCYNTKQMSRLIENIVQDCEAVGIPTKTPNEIADMLSLWESEGKNGK